MSFTFSLYMCSHVHSPGEEGRWEREGEEQTGDGTGSGGWLEGVLEQA